MGFSSWHNAVRAIPYTQKEMDNNRHRCICPENDNVNEYGDGSNLPCMSFEPDCDLCCKDCIYCEMIGPKEGQYDIALKMIENDEI